MALPSENLRTGPRSMSDTILVTGGAGYFS
jgi:hypothetical protein